MKKNNLKQKLCQKSWNWNRSVFEFHQEDKSVLGKIASDIKSIQTVKKQLTKWLKTRLLLMNELVISYLQLHYPAILLYGLTIDLKFPSKKN